MIFIEYIPFLTILVLVVIEKNLHKRVKSMGMSKHFTCEMLYEHCKHMYAFT